MCFMPKNPNYLAVTTIGGKLFVVNLQTKNAWKKTFESSIRFPVASASFDPNSETPLLYLETLYEKGPHLVTLDELRELPANLLPF
jgi:hypothetical protein